MADLVYSGRFDLNPARNTREKLLLPLSDIKPLQQPGEPGQVLTLRPDVLQIVARAEGAALAGHHQ